MPRRRPCPESAARWRRSPSVSACGWAGPDARSLNSPADTLRRFWLMLAHYHAQIWNGAELARALGTSEHTVRGYLDLLTGTFLLRQLPPWFENLGKRQYKAPKVYVRDSGLLHALLALQDAIIRSTSTSGR